MIARFISALSLGFLAAVGITWALADTIEFSMLVGIPAGIIIASLAYLVLALRGR